MKCIPVLVLACFAIIGPVHAQRVAISNPLLFCTQVPMPFDSSTCTAAFCNHQASVFSAVRGGDLWIIYPDGVTKNLTQICGFGNSGLQGANAIAVREPCVSWDGTKALFSMIVGAPAMSGASQSSFFWQIYEVSNLGEQQTPTITKIANQPTTYNNVSPIYGTDGRVIFTSDRPRDGQSQWYPQLDEYRAAVSTSGLWSLNPSSGDLQQLNDLPSGAFTPFIDSYGRVVFTRWDHLQQDGNADKDVLGTANNGTFNYTDESATATATANRDMPFPEPQGARTDLLAGTNMVGMEFNQFFPWQINEDGTSEETMNHVGRHDLRSGVSRNIKDDSNVVNVLYTQMNRTNSSTYLQNLLQISEDPNSAGTYYGIDCGDFGTHGGGQILKLQGQTFLDPGQMALSYVTDKSTASSTQEGKQPPAANSGKYRSPRMLVNGKLIASHSPSTYDDLNQGNRKNPVSRYTYRLKSLRQSGSVWLADSLITNGISKSITYYDPDTLCSFSGTLWELYPVEVRARTVPTKRVSTLAPPEKAIFTEEGVDETAFRTDLKAKGMAVIVSRNITHRDKTDHQQPFYLKVHGSSTQSANVSGKVYEVAHLQLFQGDHIRGYHFGNTNPIAGRRQIPEFIHDSQFSANPPTAGEQPYTVRIASDGSYAAIVPANRALTWALVDTAFKPVVRERYWITAQKGEIRVCASCHGTNDEASTHLDPPPQNKPEALRTLLQYWKSHHSNASAPILLSPANDSLGVDVSHRLFWQDTSGATAYRLQLSLNSDLSSPIIDDSTLTSVNYVPGNFAYNTRYYWRVRGKNDFGWGPWSDVWTFKTGSDPALVEDQTANSGFRCVPNPAKEVVTIELTLSEASNIQLLLTDALGNEVMARTLGVLSNGTHRIPIDLAEFSSGTYAVEVRSGQQVHRARIVHVR